MSFNWIISTHFYFLVMTFYLTHANIHNSHLKENMKVAIIGAGAAGLASARHCTDPAFNFTCEIFEQMAEIGGTWVYTERVGADDYNIPIHTSMYKDLVTNLPKELMEFPDFKFPDYDRSFLTQKQVLKYLHDYAKHYNVEQFIKLRHLVKEVHPLPNNRWSVTVTDLRKNENTTKEFDAVLVCNGHYSKPIMPEIEGKSLYKGIQMHSHDYRESEVFQNRTVLVIGAGPSGIDITVRLANFTSKVILSHRRAEVRWPFKSNVILKPKTVKFTENEAYFDDGTSEKVDAVIYCTGYEYSFPFLSKDCGITVDKNAVEPLYKHIVNIEKPTMGMIGLMFAVIPFPVFDYQIKLFLKHIHGDIQLPSKTKMYLDTEKEMQLRKMKGYPKHYAHKLGYDFQQIYFEELAKIAEVKPFPLVKYKVYKDTSMKPNRNANYKLIDDENFVKTIL